jgi:hypothetical protein
MRTEYCSTCLAPVATRDASCRECGFSISTVPTFAAPKQRESLLLWVFIIGVPILTLLYSVGRFDQRRAQAAGASHQAAGNADHQLHPELTDSPSTPAAFIAKCGKPVHQTTGASATDLTGTELHDSAYQTLIYASPPSTIDVIFTHSKDSPVLYRKHLQNRTYTFLTYEALVELGCVKRQ